MFDAELLFAELRDAHLDKDDVLRAVEACRRYVMRHGHKREGLRATDVSTGCEHRLKHLNAHDRKRVLVLLIKQPTLASKLHLPARGMQNALRFWRADCAPSDAFCMGKREVAYA